MISTRALPALAASLLMLVTQLWAAHAVASVTGIMPVDDAFETLQEQSVSGTVTTNDGPLTSYTPQFGDRILLAVSPRDGTLDWNWVRGEFTYTPNEGFSGSDFFKYRFCETELDPFEIQFCTSIATVKLTVAEDNQPPVALDDSFDADNTGSSVLANDEDPEGQPLTATLVAQGQRGTVSLNADGSFTYAPNDAGFSGQDSFTYKASDGELESEEATVTLTVESTVQAPVAVADMFGTSYQGMNVLANDTGDSLVAVKKSDPQKGTLTLNADGTFTYSPLDGESGQDSFTYAARTGPLDDPDALESNVAVVTLDLGDDVDGDSIVGKVDEDGYSVEGNATAQELELAGRLDVICPALEESGSTSGGQSDLQSLCSGLRQSATSARQAVVALQAITPDEVVAQRNVMRQMSRTQYQNIEGRLSELRRGARGVSVSGLNVGQGDSVVSGSALQSMLDETLMAISGGNAGDDGFDGNELVKLGLFVSGDLSFAEQDSSNREAAFDFDAQSLTFGADYRVTDQLVLGVAATAGVSEIEFEGNGGDTEADNYALAFFGSFYTNGEVFLDGIVSYGWSDVDSKRNIVYQDAGGTVDRTAQGSTDADQYYVSLNAGYLFNAGAWSMVPTVRFYHMDGGVDGYDERGAGGLNLSFDDQDLQSTTFSISGQLDYTLSSKWGVVIPYLLVEYTREFEDDAQGVRYKFSSDPFVTDDKGGYMQIKGNDADSNYMRWSAGMSAQFAHGVSGFISYDMLGSYGNLDYQTVSLGVSWEASF